MMINLLQVNDQYPPEPHSITTTTEETCYSETSKGTCDPTLCKNPEDHYLDLKDFRINIKRLRRMLLLFTNSYKIKVKIKCPLVEWKRNLVAHGDAREEKLRVKRRMEWVAKQASV